MDYHFTLRTIYPYLGELPHAILQTLYISLATIVLSFAIGIVGAIARTGRSRLLAWVAGTYVELMRNIPLLVVLYLVYFVAPGLGLRLSSFSSALIALVLNSGAYMTEILRGGLLVVPKGQFEAAHSQGMTGWQLQRHIVIPQVVRTVYAPLGNQIIHIILGSSLASVVTVEEVTAWMQNVGSSSFRFFESFTIAALVYVVLCQSVNLLRVLTGWYLFKGEQRT